MSIINHLDYNASRYEIECPKCGRKIRVYEEYQVSGCRDESFLYCPYEDCNWEDYCGSMTVEYNCYRGE